MGVAKNKVIDGKKKCSQCDRIMLRTPEFWGTHGTCADGMHSWCLECERDRSRDKNIRYRDEILKAYGGDPPRCSCCGESERSFLALDHINGGGNIEAKETKGKWIGITFKLRRKGWPPGYQILCHNCNHSKSTLGICAHVKW